MELARRQSAAACSSRGALSSRLGGTLPEDPTCMYWSVSSSQPYLPKRALTARGLRRPCSPQRRTPSMPRSRPAVVRGCSARRWRWRCMPTRLRRRGRCSTWRPSPPSTAPTFTACRATPVGDRDTGHGRCLSGPSGSQPCLPAVQTCGACAAATHALPRQPSRPHAAPADASPAARACPPCPRRQGHAAAAALDGACQLRLWRLRGGAHVGWAGVPLDCCGVRQAGPRRAGCAARTAATGIASVAAAV